MKDFTIRELSEECARMHVVTGDVKLGKRKLGCEFCYKEHPELYTLCRTSFSDEPRFWNLCGIEGKNV